MVSESRDHSDDASAISKEYFLYIFYFRTFSYLVSYLYYTIFGHIRPPISRFCSTFGLVRCIITLTPFRSHSVVFLLKPVLPTTEIQRIALPLRRQNLSFLSQLKKQLLFTTDNYLLSPETIVNIVNFVVLCRTRRTSSNFRRTFVNSSQLRREAKYRHIHRRSSFSIFLIDPFILLTLSGSFLGLLEFSFILFD